MYSDYLIRWCWFCNDYVKFSFSSCTLVNHSNYSNYSSNYSNYRSNYSNYSGNYSNYSNYSSNYSNYNSTLRTVKYRMRLTSPRRYLNLITYVSDTWKKDTYWPLEMLQQF